MGEVMVKLIKILKWGGGDFGGVCRFGCRADVCA